jgi:hypothetical protein
MFRAFSVSLVVSAFAMVRQMCAPAAVTGRPFLPVSGRKQASVNCRLILSSLKPDNSNCAALRLADKRIAALAGNSSAHKHFGSTQARIVA